MTNWKGSKEFVSFALTATKGIFNFLNLKFLKDIDVISNKWDFHLN